MSGLRIGVRIKGILAGLRYQTEIWPQTLVCKVYES